ncbi:MAG: homoserine dehydrogenase [Deltaproteobacteria bacterium]|nr:homoserine dehydrogenase [Deltaproteobacteria bacterium]
MAAGELRLGLIGLGTVGSSVVQLLTQNADAITRKTGRGLRLTAVASRSLHTKPHPDLGAARIGTDPFAIVRDPDVDVVIELIGGIEPARALVLEALTRGKPVVTANKALLALHGEEIFVAAEKAGVPICFEAAVAGGIPIIRTLREGLAADRNRALFGIVNGTCNYILTKMSDEGQEFETVLHAAQAQGLAEADPSFDIDGIDAAHKLTLLSMLAFGVRVPFTAVYTEGIRHVSQSDILFAREFGYAIKLLAIAKDETDGIDVRVHPTMIPLRSLLAEVSGAYNAIFVQGEALGSSLYFGRGAGGMPTAMSVLADVIELARNLVGAHGVRVPALGLFWKDLRVAPLRPIADLQSEYYLRFMAVDRPGVLAKIAGILGEHDISIAAVIQRDRSDGDVTVPLVMRTHLASERKLKAALTLVDDLPIVQGKSVSIRIEENFG